MSYARFGSPMEDLTGAQYNAWHKRQSAAIDALDEPWGWGDKVPEDLRGSSVYVYLDVDGYLCCCGCRLPKYGSFHAKTTDEMIAHLREHEALGDNVPPSCIARLESDREENDEWMASHE